MSVLMLLYALSAGVSEVIAPAFAPAPAPVTPPTAVLSPEPAPGIPAPAPGMAKPCLGTAPLSVPCSGIDGGGDSSAGGGGGLRARLRASLACARPQAKDLAPGTAQGFHWGSVRMSTRRTTSACPFFPAALFTASAPPPPPASALPAPAPALAPPPSPTGPGEAMVEGFLRAGGNRRSGLLLLSVASLFSLCSAVFAVSPSLFSAPSSRSTGPLAAVGVLTSSGDSGRGANDGAAGVGTLNEPRASLPVAAAVADAAAAAAATAATRPASASTAATVAARDLEPRGGVGMAWRLRNQLPRPLADPVAEPETVADAIALLLLLLLLLLLYLRMSVPLSLPSSLSTVPVPAQAAPAPAASLLRGDGGPIRADTGPCRGTRLRLVLSFSSEASSLPPLRAPPGSAD